MMKKPEKRISPQEVEKLYERHHTPSHVKAHCRAVCDVAVKVAEALNKCGYSLDLDLIRGAALAHDVARTEDKHALVGFEILEKAGYHDEAKIVKAHMTYPRFNDEAHIDECDMVCLADRVVREDAYVGLEARIEYLINKTRDIPGAAEHMREGKKITQGFIDLIEEITGESLDDVCGKPAADATSEGCTAEDDAAADARGEAAVAADTLDELLRRVEKPGRYVGIETNAVVKDPAKCDAHMVFAFPDLYEIGMSYMGMQILYKAVNSRENLYCERVFAPAPDMEALLRERNLPLFSLETKTPVKNAHLLGFTLQYELSYTTVLNMLELAGIPLRSAERGEDFPIIAAGGPCAFNPEPLAEFVDVFLIGDGEELLPDMLTLLGECRKEGLGKREFLQRACKLEGVYVPAFYEARYNDDGTIKKLCKLYEEAPLPVRKSLVDSLEEADFPTEPVIPVTDTVHNRAVVEIFRGCTRGCRFCQAGMIYRPVRERSGKTILELASSQLKNTGYDELSLLSLSTSDHSEFADFAMKLADNCADCNASLSLPSLRADKFAFEVLRRIREYKKSGLTYAPEAGTQRLRDVINKGVSEKDVLTSVEQAISLGWRHIKLYFMIGLPTETLEDLDGIADIAAKIIEINRRYNGPKGGGFRLTVSVSNFVPKADTPFQWEGQNTPEEFRRKHDYLENKLRIKGVTFNYHDSYTSVCEAVLAKGDRRCAEALSAAHRLGCRLDGWGEYFDEERWKKAFAESGIDPEFYAFRKADTEEILPWQHIDCGVSREFLLAEREKAYEAAVTRDCRYGCAGCGINERTVCSREGIYGR